LEEFRLFSDERSKAMKIDFRETNGTVREMMGELSKELSGPMQAFSELHGAAAAEGALSVKVKELIALAIGITVRCNGCIAYHVHDARMAPTG
jgi:AhpD family alkylhydroperoxidase